MIATFPLKLRHLSLFYTWHYLYIYRERPTDKILHPYLTITSNNLSRTFSELLQSRLFTSRQILSMLQSNYPNPSISVKPSSLYTHEAKYFKNKHLWGVRMPTVCENLKTCLKKKFQLFHTGQENMLKAKLPETANLLYVLFFCILLILPFTNIYKY